MTKKIAMSDNPIKPANHMDIDNIETLRIMSDPFRIQILKQLMSPSTVKSVASALNIPATKIYYHINLLEQHKLIRVISTRIVSGIVEKQYHVTAYSFGAKDGLVNTGGGANEAIALFEAGLENAKLEIRRAHNEDLIGPSDEHSEIKDGDRDVDFSHGIMTLTADQSKQFRKRLNKLLTETWALNPENAQRQEGTQAYCITVAFHRTLDPRPSKPPGASKNRAKAKKT
jgi:DNA-binding transcriptional ArsR family regulator